MIVPNKKHVTTFKWVVQALGLSALLYGCSTTGNPSPEQQLLLPTATLGAEKAILPSISLVKERTTLETALNPPEVQRRKVVKAPLWDPGEQSGSFAAISYHRVGYDNSKYTVTPEAFAEQMQILRASGYTALTVNDIQKFYKGESGLPEKGVLITIDDGHRSSYTEVHRQLALYGFNALYFPYGDFIDNGGLSTAMMREMKQTGRAEFGLHSKTHAALTEQHVTETSEDYKERVLFELQEPLAKLERVNGGSVPTIAYPYGKINRQVESWVRDMGVELGFTVNCAKNNKYTNPLRINRCTVARSDTAEVFKAKLAKPAVALALLEKSTVKPSPPEFLGHLADREFFKGVPIEPFSAYFVDPEGERLRYVVSVLPRGLSIDHKTGEVSGTPLQIMNETAVTIRAINETGSYAKSNRFRVTVY